MSKIDQLVKTIVKAIDEKDRKKTRALDTVATVSRVDGDTAWVKFAGSDQETPVKQTISVKKGDKIHVRASKGKAWIVGNETAPPTDDTLAKEALKRSDTATRTAKRASDSAIVADVMWYLASDQEEGVTTEDEGWTKEPQEVTESLPYLWAYHDYERGNGKHFKSEPVIIAMYAEDGKGIDTFTTYYALGTSTSTAPTTGWATSFTYLSGYYIWRKELITYDDGTTNWTTAVYDAGLTQSSSLSYDTAQYIWTESTGLTDVPTGQYVTEVPKASYRSNPSGGSLLMRSGGLYLRNAAQTVAQFLAAGVSLFNSSGNTLAEFLSSGLTIYNGESTEIAHLGYGAGTDSSGGTSNAPYATLGTRHIGSTIGNYSVAEGDSAEASGYTAHAEGNYPEASGFAAHAEGQFTIADGAVSHAEGMSSEAGGLCSHAQGIGTKAYGHCETVIGRYNKLSNSTPQTSEGTNSPYILVLGNGTGTYARSNAMTVKWDGTLTAGNIDSGTCSITPSAANTPTSQSVSFNKTFPSVPQVVVTPESSVAGTTLTGWAVTNITTTGFTAWVTRSNKTSTTLHWIAIG